MATLAFAGFAFLESNFPAPEFKVSFHPVPRKVMVKAAEPVAPEVPLTPMLRPSSYAKAYLAVHKVKALRIAKKASAPRAVAARTLSEETEYRLWESQRMESEEAQDAVNPESPLDEMIVMALAEASLSPSVDPDRLLSAALFDLGYEEPTFADVMPIGEVVSSLQPRAFATYREELDRLKAESRFVDEAIESPPSHEEQHAVESLIAEAKNPGPELVHTPLVPEKKIAKKVSSVQRRRPAARAATPKPTPAAPIVAKRSPPPEPVVPLREVEAPVVPAYRAPELEPREASVQPEVILAPPVVTTQKPDYSPTPSTALPQPRTEVATQVLPSSPATGWLGWIPSVREWMTPQEMSPGIVAQASPAVSSVSQRSLQSGDGVPSNSSVPSINSPITTDVKGGTIFARFTVDDSVKSWLNRFHGHYQLRLEAAGSVHPDDTIYLPAVRLGEDFEIPGRDLRRAYHLVAKFFSPKLSEVLPVSQVVFPNVLSATNYKPRVRFHVDSAKFTAGYRELQSGKPKWGNFTAAVFEGASGDFANPKPIPGAEIRILGYPQIPTMRTDAQGMAAMAKVPLNSELYFEVSAPGYYPTDRIVRIEPGKDHTPIYLLAKSKVSAITSFTKSPQKAGSGFVLGRVFDPKTRVPKAGEELALSFRKGPALYMDALPSISLKQTTPVGLFGFFNVAPSFRSLVRSSQALAYFWNVRPDHGYYVEMGRGGLKTITGKLVAPDSELEEAIVSVVGDPHNRAAVDDQGAFSLKSDLPDGVFTLQVESRGFPTTWHTVSVKGNTQQSLSLLMLNEELVYESAPSVAPMSVDRRLGTLVGGAGPSMLSNECITVQLETLEGKTIDSEKGPFALYQKTKRPELCLSKEENVGFRFHNLPAGEYILKWLNSERQPFRSRVVRVDSGKVAIVVN